MASAWSRAGRDRAGERLAREEPGIGMRNVRERMEVLYGDQAEVEIVSRPGRGTRVRLSMPVMSSPQRTSSAGTQARIEGRVGSARATAAGAQHK